MQYKSNFFAWAVRDLINFHWVDFETLYYQELLSLFDMGDKRGLSKLLNDDLEYIKLKFIEYLSFENEMVRETPSSLIQDYHDLMLNGIERVNNSLIHGESKRPARVRLLNFNYTTLISHYLKHFPRGDIGAFQLHGHLQNKSSVIMGYGNHKDDHYAKLESLNEDEMIKNLKILMYGQNSTYRELSSFVDNNVDGFEVFIFGHSLGISDKSILSQILEHEKLRRVKIFYHDKGGEDDFSYKYRQLSRHVYDKDRLIKLTEPKDISKAMPQIKK